jgi:hypothetical protein
MARSEPFFDLSAEQLRAVSALLEGRTAEQAAKAGGVSKSTLYRWRRDYGPFREALQHGRREQVEAAQQIMLTAGRAAAGVVLGVLQSPTAPAAIKLAAARLMLESASKWIEISDLAARIEALEAGKAGP